MLVGPPPCPPCPSVSIRVYPTACPFVSDQYNYRHQIFTTGYFGNDTDISPATATIAHFNVILYNELQHIE